MQERQVTVGGNEHQLPDPFFVLATQNPIEQEGTYPLPEAQLDRFMFNIKVDYPSEEEEFRIVETTTRRNRPHVDRVLTPTTSWRCRTSSARCRWRDHVIRYAMRLDAADAEPTARMPRTSSANYVTWGAGPRASQYLILAAKARAVLHGRPYVATRGRPGRGRARCLRHRIITNFNAEADGVKPDDIVRRLIEGTPVEA